MEYAYEDHATLENYLKEQNIKFKKVKYFEVENAQGYGISTPYYNVLAFRGTEPTSFKVHIIMISKIDVCEICANIWKCSC